MAIDAVAKTIGRIAGKARCAAEGVHHARKTGGAEVTADDSRGATLLLWQLPVRFGCLTACQRRKRSWRAWPTTDAPIFVQRSTRRISSAFERDLVSVSECRAGKWKQSRYRRPGLCRSRDLLALAELFADLSISDLRAVQDRICRGRLRRTFRRRTGSGRPLPSPQPRITTKLTAGRSAPSSRHGSVRERW